MKNNISKIIILFIIVIVLFISFFKIKDTNTNQVSKILDVTKDVNIDGKLLKITYVSGNMIDEKISYNNTFEKEIIVENTNNEIVSYSIELYDSLISNEELVYSIEASNEKNGKYKSVVQDKSIKGDQTLGYNFAIDANSTIYLKIVFKALHLGNVTDLKGILNIKSNLTEKDIFVGELANISASLENKIDELNGIGVAGNYIISIDELKVETQLKGYILINAEDISSIEYYYTVYTDKYMIKNYNLIGTLSKQSIIDLDVPFISSLNKDTICSLSGKKNCSSFNDLTYNTSGGKKTFDDNSKKVIKLVKDSFNGTEKKAYIYDVSVDINNPTDIRGYILIDNTKEEKEYYIYLTNNMFMISGYNITKYGEFNYDSTTIRAYVESAYNLSSENAKKVCSFSGFNECINKEGNII